VFSGAEGSPTWVGSKTCDRAFLKHHVEVARRQAQRWHTAEAGISRAAAALRLPTMADVTAAAEAAAARVAAAAAGAQGGSKGRTSGFGHPRLPTPLPLPPSGTPRAGHALPLLPSAHPEASRGWPLVPVLEEQGRGAVQSPSQGYACPGMPGYTRASSGQPGGRGGSRAPGAHQFTRHARCRPSHKSPGPSHKLNGAIVSWAGGCPDAEPGPPNGGGVWGREQLRPQQYCKQWYCSQSRCAAHGDGGRARWSQRCGVHPLCTRGQGVHEQGLAVAGGAGVGAPRATLGPVVQARRRGRRSPPTYARSSPSTPSARSVGIPAAAAAAAAAGAPPFHWCCHLDFMGSQHQNHDRECLAWAFGEVRVCTVLLSACRVPAACHSCASA